MNPWYRVIVRWSMAARVISLSLSLSLSHERIARRQRCALFWVAVARRVRDRSA